MSNGAALPTGVTQFIVLFTSADRSLQIYTTNLALVGTYNLVIKASFSDGYRPTYSVTSPSFTITLFDPCSLNTITTIPTMATLYYIIGHASIIQKWQTWGVSIP